MTEMFLWVTQVEVQGRGIQPVLAATKTASWPTAQAVTALAIQGFTNPDGSVADASFVAGPNPNGKVFVESE